LKTTATSWVHSRRVDARQANHMMLRRRIPRRGRGRGVLDEEAFVIGAAMKHGLRHGSDAAFGIVAGGA